MPRYDYKCEAGHKYELQQPFNSPMEHACQKCGKPAHRMLTAPPLIFKAGGYYKSSGRDFSSDSGSGSSDSKSEKASKSKSATDERGSEKPAAKKPEAKADAKPAAKPAAKKSPKS